MTQPPPRILYCHCRYAQVVPPSVKDAVLRQLCEAGVAFEAVPDLCELSARRDPEMARLAAAGTVKIAACFPRAVKWLFASADMPLDPATTEVINMRTGSADDLVPSLLSTEMHPNLPAGKTEPTAAATATEPELASTPGNTAPPAS